MCAGIAYTLQNINLRSPPKKEIRA